MGELSPGSLVKTELSFQRQWDTRPGSGGGPCHQFKEAPFFGCFEPWLNTSHRTQVHLDSPERIPRAEASWNRRGSAALRRRRARTHAALPRPTVAEADLGLDLADAPALGWRSTLSAPNVSTQDIKGVSAITRRGLGRDRVGWTAPFQPPWPAHANSILESWVLHLPFGSSG